MAKNSEDAHQGEEIQEVRMKPGGGSRETRMARLLKLQVGHDDPVDVDTVHADDPNRGGTKAPGGPFSGLGQKK